MDAKLNETEVKLYVPDLAPVRARLDVLGARLESDRVYERNVRYENQTETFTGQGIVLRLREDRRVRLTYKEPPAMLDDVMSRFEAEVTVDDFQVMDLILQRLGFKPHVIYEKYRTTYQFGAVEVVLDEMPYGHFVEIEGAVNAITAAIESLDLGEAPRMGMSYLSLFDQVKQALGLEIDNLTFDNFEGVEIPPEVFRRGR